MAEVHKTTLRIASALPLLFFLSASPLILSSVSAQEECTPHDLSIDRSLDNQMVASATTVQCNTGATLHLGADCQFNISDAGSGVSYLSGPAPIEVLSPPGFVGTKNPGDVIVPGVLEPIEFGIFELKFTAPGTYILRGFPTGFDSDAAGVVDVTITVTGGEFTINYTTFIPGNNNNTLLLCRSDDRPPKFAFPLYVRFDDRDFDPSATTYRTRQLVTVIPDESADPDGLKEGTLFEALTNPTQLYAPDALPVIDDNDDDGVLHDCHLLHDIVSPVTDMHIRVTRTGPKTVAVHLFGHGGTGVPFRALRPCPISWDFFLHIDTSGSRPTVAISGAHDGFPAHEIYVNDQPVYRYSPGPPPYGLSDILKLCGPLDVSVEKIVELPD